MSTPDPDELLRQLDPGIAELKVKAEQAQERAATSSATRRSPDGSVSVTVGAGGNLTGLELNERAYQRPPRQLAAEIMGLVSQAQQQVSAEVMAAFSSLVGPDSPALSVLTPFLPQEPTDDAQDAEPTPHPDDPFDSHPGGYGPPAQQAPQAQPQRRPRRRRGPDDDVEPDYDEDDLLS